MVRAAAWRSWPTGPTQMGLAAAGNTHIRCTTWAPTSQAGSGRCCPRLPCRWKRNPGTLILIPEPGEWVGWAWGHEGKSPGGHRSDPCPSSLPRYTCPFVEKFSIEIETYYLPDGGQQPNVFNLSGAERRQRILGEAWNQWGDPGDPLRLPDASVGSL